MDEVVKVVVRALWGSVAVFVILHAIKVNTEEACLRALRRFRDEGGK